MVVLDAPRPIGRNDTPLICFSGSPFVARSLSQLVSCATATSQHLLFRAPPCLRTQARSVCRLRVLLPCNLALWL